MPSRIVRVGLAMYALGLVVGCGASAEVSPSDGGQSRGDAQRGILDAGAAADGAACGRSATLIVKYSEEVPDAGRAAVQVPDIAVVGSDLFYLSNWYRPLAAGGGGDGQLMRVSVRGGAPSRLAFVPGGGSDGGQGLVVTATKAIFSQAARMDGGDGAIIGVPVGGGGATIIAQTTGRARALLADSENVYFVDNEATKMVALGGGPVRTLAKATPYSIGLVGATLYLAEYGGANTLSSIPIQGGTVSLVATVPGGVLYPVGCGANLCWVGGPPFAAKLMRLAPGGTPVELAQGFREPLGLLFDEKNFFVTSGGAGLQLLRIPEAGGPALTVAAGQLISEMAMDESCLYWSSAQGIFSMSKAAADVAGSNGQ